ncbi:MAG: TlyA family RNA methyltransferase [Anaerolineae bacterium]|nr:TlyA family RNA methyltransferase [Anaerolineae bacterium]
MAKVRLDRLLIEKGLLESRSKAQALIMAGRVAVDGQVVTKAGMQISSEAKITIEGKLPYVSRGGLKLAAALDAFGVNLQNNICADVGSSTGGFTDVLLQRGAMRVYAIDVGYGQLAWKLRRDNRVMVMERTNARYLKELPEAVELVTIDTSFISLKHIFPAVTKWLAVPATVIALVKPQFEAGRFQVARGGVVRDSQVHRQVLEKVSSYAAQSNLAVQGLIQSPITGPAGNYEFLLHLGWQIGPSSVDLAEAIETCLSSLPPLS